MGLIIFFVCLIVVGVISCIAYCEFAEKYGHHGKMSEEQYFNRIRDNI